MSTILAMPEKDQKRVFDILEQFVPKEVISPLTILYTFSQNPYFASRFTTQEYDVKKSSSILERVMKKATAFTSDFSTDIAFFIVYTFAVNGKIHLPKNKGSAFTPVLPLLSRVPPNVAIIDAITAFSSGSSVESSIMTPSPLKVVLAKMAVISAHLP